MESYLVSLFRDANVCANHANRITIIPDAQPFSKPTEVVAWKVVFLFVVYFLTIRVNKLCFALAKLGRCLLNSNISCYFESCFVDSGSTEPVGAWRSDGDRTIAHHYSHLRGMTSMSFSIHHLIDRLCVRLVPVVYRPFGLNLTLM